jgi:hypothetical protein
LQRLDQFREWRSLDEQRYYLSCGALITGGKSKWWEARG